MKKILQTAFVLIIITIIFNFSIVYADPGSSRGFADFDDETAEKQAQELEKEQQEEAKKREGKSSNNYLESLSIDELQPTFDKETQEYFINGIKEGQKIKINAVPSENTATVSGTGDIEVKNNEARIDVTAENGTVRTYFIIFNMQETENQTETNKEESEIVNNITTEDDTIKKVSNPISSNETKTENKDESNIVTIIGVIVAVFVIIAAIIILVKKRQKKGRHF